MLLKNRNISSKIKRSKVTDYAALTISQLKLSRLSYILVETMPFLMDKSKSKKGLQYLKGSLY